MKILILIGTRPEIIRLACVILLLKELADKGVIQLVLVFTNQNYNHNLSEIFFNELQLPKPDYIFPQSSNFLGDAFNEFAKVLDNENPDKVLILGDTNSGLLCMLAEKRWIPCYHLEAGNRCLDKKVPEETNRKIIDAFSTYNLPYTDNSKENLIREGHDKNHVFKIGNPINGVLEHYHDNIVDSEIITKLNLFYDSYVLLTLHRTENVDDYDRASDIAIAINEIAKHIQVVFPMHPRTKDQFANHELVLSPSVKVIDPLGFFDFVKLEKNSKLIITDSGTCCEESTIFFKPCIILRDTIERQELIECGSVVLAGANADNIIRAYKSLTYDCKWDIPLDYTKDNVSDTVIKILLGK